MGRSRGMSNRCLVASATQKARGEYTAGYPHPSRTRRWSCCALLLSQSGECRWSYALLGLTERFQERDQVLLVMVVQRQWLHQRVANGIQRVVDLIGTPHARQVR